MKSIKIFAVAGAIGLLCMAGLSSCKQNNTPEGPESYDGSTVKTEFVIKIADKVAGNNNGTKYMMGDDVQKDGTRAQFRGMENIILIPYADANSDGAPAASNAERTGKDIVSLANIPTTIPSSPTYGQLTSTESTIVYQSVSIPLGTKNFLFYGKSDDGTVSTDAQMHQYGKVLVSGLDKSSALNSGIADIHFDPKPIYTLTGTPDPATKLAACVTEIAGASYTDGESTTHLWSSCSATAPGLKGLYDEFITLQAGSSNAILATLTDLYNTLERQKDTYVAGTVPMGLATAIMTLIDKYTTITSGSAYERVLAWEAIGSYDYSIFNTPANQYPASINLPDGAAVIAWNGSTAFAPVTNPDKLGGTLANASNLTITDIKNFVYPASLWYYANSTIETAKSSQKDKYDGANDWTAILANYTDNGVVASNTKSVAIHDEINYGVGMLDLSISRKISAGDPVEFEDNEGNKFDISTGGSLKLKGVLIGGQKGVDYKFEQNTALTAYTLYDNYLDDNSGAKENGLVPIPNNGDAIHNYTLVFSTENFDAASEEKNIQIAIELVNDLKTSFVGVNGKVIPKGGTFYLIATLNPYASTGVTKDPGTGSTNTPEHNNVFYKDYSTVVNLTLGSNCLKSAYYTIPDLRSSNLELGFSVDLTWKTGIAFDIELN